MKRSLRPWQVLLLFGALAVAGDRLLSLAALQVVRASHFRLAEIYGGRVDADIVVFGNSRGVHSLYSPRLSELTCRPAFNAAYNGLSLDSMVLAFEDYLERNRPPKFALFEITASATREHAAYELRTFTSLSPRLSRFYPRIDPAYPFWSRLTHLYHFDTELFLRCLYYLRRDDQDWIIEGRHITEDMIRSYDGLEHYTMEMPLVKSWGVKLAIRHAAAAGVQPIFYIAPYHPVVFERTAGIDEWLAQLSSMSSLGAPVLDFSHALTGDPDFADPLHLNKRGSYKFIDAFLASPEGRRLSACRAPTG